MASQKLLDAAGLFVERALKTDDSLFTPGQPIWSLANLDDLHLRFVDRFEIGEGDFLQKMHTQLTTPLPTAGDATPAATFQLMGELLYTNLLPLRDTGGNAKRNVINQVLAWSPVPISVPADLAAVLDDGVANGGAGFNIHRPYNLKFLIEFAQKWKQQPAATRSQMLADPWAFRQFAFLLPIEQAYAQREILLYLVHPDTFMHTMSREHKKKIVQAFRYLVTDATANVDQQLLEIAQALPDAFPEIDFSGGDQTDRFYDYPTVRAVWEPPATAPAKVMGQVQEEEEMLDESITIAVGTDFYAGVLQILGSYDTAITTQELYAVFDQQFGASLDPRLHAPNNYKTPLWKYNIGWALTNLRVKGLAERKGRGRWQITSDGLDLLAEATDYAMLNERIKKLPSIVGVDPDTPTIPLDTYLTFATMLTDPSYTADELLAEFGRISPPLWEGTPPTAPELLEVLRRLRLLEPLGEGRYCRWAFLVDSNMSTMPVLRRLSVLAMVLPDGTGGYTMPATYLPLDGQPHPPAAWLPLDEQLLEWYVQAGILQYNDADDTYQSLPDALTPDSDSGVASTTLNTLLVHLRTMREQAARPIPSDDLPRLDPATLDERIREIQRDLLIDRQTIRRIYRALIAGQHVILSGPPGTGKTHLATRLPAILWRKQWDELALPPDPDLPPDTEPQPITHTWHGYHAELVTATEDWGVRDVIGGIAPHLQGTGESTRLGYRVRHGCLVRAVLGNYAGYRDGSVPNPDRRTTPTDADGKTYRGRWLVIDEFTRAPIDAAFGSLLTTLGGSSPVLRVPTDAGEVPFPMPADFRIIGTLNSFDRHFLNQISEAMKRRFVFIDILPPTSKDASNEYAAALFHELPAQPDANTRRWQHNGDTLSVGRSENADHAGSAFGVAYELDRSSSTLAIAAVDHVQHIFQTIRVYRQLGTAQVRAVYRALLTGVEVGMLWDEALDTAFADTLADQLQILTRDEQQVLLTYLAHAGDADAFATAITQLLAGMPDIRKQAHPFVPSDGTSLTPDHLRQHFALGDALALPQHSLFVQRLQGFLHERGL